MSKEITNLIILPQKTDLGDANGFNTGIFYALNNQKPDFIGLIRAELRPTDGWLEILLKEFQSDRRIVMVGSEIKSFDRSWDDIANFWPFSKLNLDKLTRGEVIAVSDQACLIRSQVLRELGYFDGDFYQTLEDWDFGLRATLLGYKIIFQPKAKAEREQSEPQPSSIYWYLLIRNFNYLWIKNIPTPLAIRYWYEWFNLTFRLSLRAWGEGAWLSPFRAQLKTLVKLPRLIVWRSSIQRRRQLKLTELVKSNGREQ